MQFENAFFSFYVIYTPTLICIFSSKIPISSEEQSENNLSTIKLQFRTQPSATLLAQSPKLLNMYKKNKKSPPILMLNIGGLIDCYLIYVL